MASENLELGQTITFTKDGVAIVRDTPGGPGAPNVAGTIVQTVDFVEGDGPEFNLGARAFDPVAT